MSRPVMLIAGGSRGIGAATARLAGARGYDVAVNYKNNSNAAAGVVNAVKKAGGKAIAVQGDMHASLAGVLHGHHIIDLPENPATTLALDRLLKDRSDTIAAIVVEPLVQGAGGMGVAPYARYAHGISPMRFAGMWLIAEYDCAGG